MTQAPADLVGRSLTAPPRLRDIHLARWLPILAIHALCLGLPLVGWSWTAVWVAVAFYLLRMFVITAFYHRYFSHRAFRTWRWAHTLAGFIGSMSAQRGPLWWAAHHRDHHRRSDQPDDAHSPRHHGILWSHLGWFVAEPNLRTRSERVPDLAALPELRWLDQHHMLAPVVAMAALFGLGTMLAAWQPALGTGGAQLLVWGFGVSTVVLYHATFTINAFAHRFGTQRYATGDDSRNHWFLALLTLGEGWHNNHHAFPAAVRQGFRWWELDVTWYLLLLLRRLGLVWDLRPVPAAAAQAAPARPGD